MPDANLMEIFCILDEFCKYLEPELKKRTIDTSGRSRRNRPPRMSDSEIMLILIIFHTYRFRELKSFYLGYVCKHMHKEFPRTLSYNRFVERQMSVGPPLASLSIPAPWGNVPVYPSLTLPHWWRSTSKGNTAIRQ